MKDDIDKMKSDTRYRGTLAKVAERDVLRVLEKDNAYGASWKKRGGVGAYMNVARKMDRLDTQLEMEGWDIFGVCCDQHILGVHDGILDDIADLRRYLLLVEADLMVQFDDIDNEREQRNQREMEIDNE